MAQTNAIPNAVNEPAGFSGWLGAVQEWAEENLDENLLAALGGGIKRAWKRFSNNWGWSWAGNTCLIWPR